MNNSSGSSSSVGLNSSIIFTEDGFVNVSSAEEFSPIYVNSISIGNSLIFLILYICYFIIFGALLFRISIKNSSAIKRNQKIIFSLIALLIIVQCSHLICGIIHDSLLIQCRLIIEGGERITYNLYFVTFLFSGISIFLLIYNILILVSTMCTIQLIFLRTAMEMRAISKSTFEGIRISSLIVTTLFSILFISTDITANVFFFLSKLQFFPSYDVSYYGIITISCSVVLFLIKDTIGVIAAGILVLKTIRNVSNKIRNATNDSKSKNPFIVTILLLFGLLSCVFLQIFAACLSLGWENLKYAAQFINNIGILVFVILALVLFYPILNNKKRNTQVTEITPTITIPTSNKEQFFTKVQSDNTPSSLSAQSPQTLEDLFKNSIV